MTARGDSPPKIPLIDPTLNVKELVERIETFRDALRAADVEYNRMVMENDRRRHDDLAAQKAAYDQAQATALRHEVDRNAAYFLAEMHRGFAGVNDRITADISSTNERIAQLEKFRYESSGKGSGASTVMAYVVTFISVLIAAVSMAIAVFKH